jgi:hypothetical protein
VSAIHFVLLTIGTWTLLALLTLAAITPLRMAGGRWW